MNFFTVFFVAVALAMDAFAVSVASSVLICKHRLRRAFTFGLMFGGFQMIMPVVGWAAGRTFRSLITGVDHWIAFGLLFLIGLKMIWEAFKIERIEQSCCKLTWLVLLGLSLATSMDALATGISFAFLEVSIVLPVAVIGAVTFVLSFTGVVLGSRLGGKFEQTAEILGGAILIAIGFQILIKHLLG
ncbi:MAG TPA: manganese efflux pump MntP family protein [Candidatus Omnitrophota bacterium]|jgi:putative Mn2+ efflux pump MntP|nr:manganese efflux pump MntP family protein [Candidatus Omnitrophota bacterium]